MILKTAIAIPPAKVLCITHGLLMPGVYTRLVLAEMIHDEILGNFPSCEDFINSTVSVVLNSVPENYTISIGGVSAIPEPAA